MTLGDKIFNWVKAQNTNDCYPTMSDIQSHFAPRKWKCCWYGTIISCSCSLFKK